MWTWNQALLTAILPNIKESRSYRNRIYELYWSLLQVQQLRLEIYNRQDKFWLLCASLRFKLLQDRQDPLQTQKAGNWQAMYKLHLITKPLSQFEASLAVFWKVCNLWMKHGQKMSEVSCLETSSTKPGYELLNLTWSVVDKMNQARTIATRSLKARSGFRNCCLFLST